MSGYLFPGESGTVMGVPDGSDRIVNGLGIGLDCGAAVVVAGI